LLSRDGRDDHTSIVALACRYWKLTIPVMVIAAAAAVALQIATPQQHRATGTVMLAASDLDATRQPLAQVDLEAAVRQLQSPDVQGDIAGDGASVRATLIDAATIEVVGTAGSPRLAESTAAAAVDWLDAHLSQRQDEAGVAEPDRAAMAPLTPSVVARRTQGGDYDASAVLWLSNGAPGVDNPYGPSEATAQLLAVSLTTGDARSAVESRIDRDVEFTVRQLHHDLIPALTIVANGPDPTAVVEAFDEIVGVLQLELAGRQARAAAPLDQRAFVDVLAAPAAAERTSPRLSPAALLVALGGLVIAIVAAALLELRRTGPAARHPRPEESRNWFNHVEVHEL
jgi:hypothetical protein